MPSPFHPNSSTSSICGSQSGRMQQQPGYHRCCSGCQPCTLLGSIHPGTLAARHRRHLLLQFLLIPFCFLLHPFLCRLLLLLLLLLLAV
jgi:hypothetical protein